MLLEELESRSCPVGRERPSVAADVMCDQLQERSMTGAVTWQRCNQITGKGRWEIMLFPHTMLLRNTDGAVKENGLIAFPDNRLQKAFEHLLLSLTKGDVTDTVGCSACSGNAFAVATLFLRGFTRSISALLFYLLLLLLVPFTSLLVSLS